MAAPRKSFDQVGHIGASSISGHEARAPGRHGDGSGTARGQLGDGTGTARAANLKAGPPAPPARGRPSPSSRSRPVCRPGHALTPDWPKGSQSRGPRPHDQDRLRPAGSPWGRVRFSRWEPSLGRGRGFSAAGAVDSRAGAGGRRLPLEVTEPVTELRDEEAEWGPAPRRRDPDGRGEGRGPASTCGPAAASARWAPSPDAVGAPERTDCSSSLPHPRPGIWRPGLAALGWPTAPHPDPRVVRSTTALPRPGSGAGAGEVWALPPGG